MQAGCSESHYFFGAEGRFVVAMVISWPDCYTVDHPSACIKNKLTPDSWRPDDDIR
jgi:hypothetical protein